MLKTKTTATFLAVLVSAILLGALPSLALVRADSGSDSSGSSSQPTCPDGSTPDSNGNCPNNSQQSQPQQQQQQTCPDGSTPDSNGNCPNNSQQSQPQQQQTSTKDQICNALHVKDIGILAPLLVALHLITLGASTVAILGAAAAYCG